MVRGQRIFQHYLTENLNRKPELTAVEWGDATISYRELQSLSDRVGSRIIKQTASVGSQIGIMMSRRIDIIIAVIGILKARRVFVPIDPTLPVERIQGMLDGVDLELLLCDDSIEPQFTRDIHTIRIKKMLEEHDDGLPEISYDPDDKIYIYFTSGTSGKPKAIVGKNKSLQHFVEWEIETFGFSEGSRVSQLVHPGFDAFLRDVFVPLCCGGTVCIPKEEDVAQGAGALCRWLDRNRIHAMHCVPSVFRVICQYHDLRQTMFEHLKWVMLSGEKIEISILNRWYEIFGNRTQIVNFYGPTETTMIKTFHIIEAEDLERERIPVGKPMKGARVLILDQRMNVCRPLVAGEIYIRTPYATHGYYKDDELNRRLFVPNPLTGKSDDRVFKTGDLGRYQKDGTIDLLGRIDRQVKIRGIRVELEEIEAVMKDCPGIDRAVVDVRDIGENNRVLCAYITSSDGGVDGLVSRMKDICYRRLPDVMVPENIQVLEEIPLKPNGKIDYSALPGPLDEGAEEVERPQTDLEQRLYQIWIKILGTKDFGVTQPFFRLGGNSLSVLSLISIIHREFDRKFTLKEVFQHNTIRQQAELLDEGGNNRYQTISIAETMDYYPLSPAQERMYLVHQMNPSSLAYNVPVACNIVGHLDEFRLRGVFNQLIQRHQCLRTSFIKTNEGIKQHVHTVVELRFEQDEIIRPFDLASPPLLRVAVREIGETEHLLFVDMHHIVADGISMAVLMKEFTQLYRGETLKENQVDYKDYVLWMRSDPQQELVTKQREFWLCQLDGELPRLNLPLDFPRPRIRSFSGKSLQFQLGSDNSSRLRAFASNEELTLHMIFLSVYVILLSKLSGQEEILVGTPVSGRGHQDLQDMVGMFVNTLVLRLFPGGDCAVREFLHKVKSTTLAALDHQNVYLETLVDDLEFDVCFVMQNMQMPALDIPGLRLEAKPLEGNTAKFDLTMRVDELGDDLLVTLEYCSDLFLPATIQRWAGYIENIVKEVADRPETRLHSMDIMTPQEKEWLISTLNNAEVPYPEETTIHQLFGEKVHSYPHAIAISGGEGNNRLQFTYSFLDHLSNRVCSGLENEGAVEGSIVALYVGKRVETIAAIIGTLKAGCAYCPVDLDQPADRAKYIIKDSAARVVVIDEKAKIDRTLPEVSTRTIDQLLRNPEPGENGPMATDSSFPAYVIYTSGTTGQPKGVVVEHRNVVRLFFNDSPIFDFGNHDVWTLFHSICFDFSVWEMYGALLFGGRLEIIPKAIARDSRLFLKLLVREHVTILNQTPSAFKNLMDEESQAGQFDLKTRIVIFGGEALNPNLLQDFHLRYPAVRLVNMYGITETTVHVTYKELMEQDIEKAVSAIGRPIPTLNCIVADPNLKICPIGVAGELIVSGAGVARGYLNRPQLTGEFFISDQTLNNHSPMYRSGDLARVLPNGDLEYLGRVDHQVKIRGFRIEPGEIESRLLSHDQVAEAVVVPWKNGGSEQSLCAYIVPQKDTSSSGINSSMLREYLALRLPDYMIPALFVQMDAMPLTANGKVDRRRLPEPVMNRIDSSLAPLEEKELCLANIWADVLDVKIDLIGRDSNFFELGGHSLKAAKLSSEIHRKMGIDISLTTIFANPGLRLLAQILDHEHSSSEYKIQPVEKQDYYPQTPGQNRIFLLNQLEDTGLSYNMPCAFQISGPLAPERLHGAFQKLISRHSALRTSFHMVDGLPVQKVHSEDWGLVIEELDISGDNSVDRLMEGFFHPFDLSRVPLFRVGHGELEPKRYLLLIDSHHIVTDGLSIRILVEDFVGFYNGEYLAKLEISYQDYACWLAADTNRERIEEQLRYWKETFGNGIPISQLPTDYRREESRSFRGSDVPIHVDGELSRQLLDCARSQETTVFNVMMAVFVILLSRLGGQREVVVGTVTAGRERREIEDMVGMFVNTLAVKYDCPDDLTISELVRDIEGRSQRAFANQDVQFEDLVRELKIEVQPGKNPLFDAMLVMQNFELPDMRLPGLEIQPLKFNWDQAKFDLTLFVFEQGQQLQMKFEYDSSLFREGTVIEMGECLLHIARQLGASLANPVGDISIRHPEQIPMNHDFTDDLEHE